MNLDFQLDLNALQSAVIQTVQQQLVARRVCVPGTFAYPFDGLTNPATPAAVDHLTVDEARIAPTSATGSPPFGAPLVDVTVFVPSADPMTPTTRTVQAAPIRVAVVATLWIARLSDLVSAGVTPVATDRLKAQQVRLVYTISVSVASGQAALAFHFEELQVAIAHNIFVDVSALPADAQIPADVLMAAESQLGSIPATPLDVSAINQLLDPSYGLWNAGASITGHTLTLRLQVDQLALSPLAGTVVATQDAWAAAWTAFYANGAANRLGGNQWGLFVDAEVFERGAEGQIRSGLAGRTDLALLDADPPHATWAVEGGHAAVHTHFGVNIPGACKPWNADIQANVDLTLAVTGRPGILRLDLHVAFSPYAGEVFLCAIGNSLIGGFVGLVVGGVIANWPGAIVGAIIGGVVAFVGTFVGAYTYGLPDGTHFGPFQPVHGSNSDFFNEVPISFPSSSTFGALTMTGVVPFSDGLVLGGTLGGAIQTPAELVVAPLPAGFGWQAADPCPDPAVDAIAAITGGCRGGTPLYFCQPQVLSSNAALYASQGSSLTWPQNRLFVAGAGWTVREVVTPEAVAALQAANGSGPAEPFTVLLQSSGGARVLTIAGVDATLDEASRQNASAARAFECNRRRVQPGGGFHLPPGDQGDPWRDRRGDVEWNILARGLGKGAALLVHDDRGQVLARVEAGAGGDVAARLWIGEKDRGNGIDVALENAGEAVKPLALKVIGAGATGPVVAAGRALYARTATIAAPGTLARHAIARVEGAVTLVVAGDAGVSVYNLANPAAPRRIAHGAGKDAPARVGSTSARAPIDLTHLVAVAGPPAAIAAPARSARLGDIAVTASPDGTSLDVLTLVDAEMY